MQPGGVVPHFEVTTVTGERFSYRSIWQRLNLVLAILPASEPEASSTYTGELVRRAQEFAHHQACCVVTHDAVDGLAGPAVLIADRWGEIVHVAAGRHVSGLPDLDDVLAWTAHVQARCPECEGEAR